jgi:hypothetical protein
MPITLPLNSEYLKIDSFFLKDKFINFDDDDSFLKAIEKSATVEEKTVAEEEVNKAGLIYEAAQKFFLTIKDFKDYKETEEGFIADLVKLQDSWSKIPNPIIRMLIKLNYKEIAPQLELSLLFHLPPQLPILTTCLQQLFEKTNASSTIEYLKSNQNLITPDFLIPLTMLTKITLDTRLSILNLNRMLMSDKSRSLEDRLTFSYITIKLTTFLAATDFDTVAMAGERLLKMVREEYEMGDVPTDWILETFLTLPKSLIDKYSVH